MLWKILPLIILEVFLENMRLWIKSPCSDCHSRLNFVAGAQDWGCFNNNASCFCWSHGELRNTHPDIAVPFHAYSWFITDSSMSDRKSSLQKPSQNWFFVTQFFHQCKYRFACAIGYCKSNRKGEKPALEVCHYDTTIIKFSFICSNEWHSVHWMNIEFQEYVWKINYLTIFSFQYHISK